MASIKRESEYFIYTKHNGAFLEFAFEYQARECVLRLLEKGIGYRVIQGNKVELQLR